MIYKNRYKIKIVSKCTLTRAPMTPKLVSLRYSKGLVLLVVFKKGYRYSGMWAEIHTKYTENILQHGRTSSSIIEKKD